MEASVLTHTEFLDFPSGIEILALLGGLDSGADDLEPLFHAIANRLGERTYERSAAAFLLIESIYDYQEVVDRELSYLLPRCVFVLTGDRDLALSALSAFNEIQDALKMQGPMVVEADATVETIASMEGAPTEREPNSSVPSEGARESETTALDDTVPVAVDLPGRVSADRADELLEGLQVAQKELSDAGLSARISLDLAARRPTPDRAERTQQDLDRLRGTLDRFTKLLEHAEAEVLAAFDEDGETAPSSEVAEPSEPADEQG